MITPPLVLRFFSVLVETQCLTEREPCEGAHREDEGQDTDRERTPSASASVPSWHDHFHAGGTFGTIRKLPCVASSTKMSSGSAVSERTAPSARPSAPPVR